MYICLWAKQPGDPANVLPAALCQGVFEVSAVWCVSALIIIIIQSICMALFMDHKDASESKHVNRYDDMWGGVVVENHVTLMLSP